jgi:hypothetical protein
MDAAETRDILDRVDRLFEDWCDRRAAAPLRELLNGYPLSNPLTDGWADLLASLEGVRAFGRDDLTDAELDEVEKLVAAISPVVTR